MVCHREIEQCSIHDEAYYSTLKPMDQTDAGEGQDKPSEQSLYLSPSSKGRQRKKNSKYLDFDTENTDDVKSNKQKSPRKSPQKGLSPQETPAKHRKTKTSKKQTANRGKESAEQTVLVTPRRQGKTRKTQPATKPSAAVSAGGDLAIGEAGGGVAENPVQQENGTPKPKRKYVRKKPVEEVKHPEDVPAAPDEEVESGGRGKRGAAKAALKYLQLVAKEVFSNPRDEANSKPHDEKASKHKAPKGRKRKHNDDDEASDDEDFVPNMEDEDADEADAAEEGAVSDSNSDIVTQKKFSQVFYTIKKPGGTHGKPLNGLELNIIKAITETAETTRKFREEHHSSWVFPEWVPSTNDWKPVLENDLEEYLPQELGSAAFKVSREGLKQEEKPQLRLGRFEATAAHPGRWDMFMFAGGPIWALEWCPTPDGAPASQYIALACHRGMDDLHRVNQIYSGPGFVQLWDCGKLEYDKSPDSQPSLVYGLAQDKGFIWQLKWCPAGGWELPNSVRKDPFMPRLGLLAVATSSGVVTIYSLPHPDALLSHGKLTHSEKYNDKPLVYKPRGVITLKLGCIKSPRKEQSGQALSMDWLPQKPHNIMAIGFYDGVVGLWDLSTKSALLRVRESDRSLTLLPYRCILAHDNAVVALALCPSSRYLLTTAGEDRYIKTWDLRRLYDAVKVQKRCLTTELCWPLDSPGVLMAQESAFAPKYSTGVYYIDHFLRSHFAIPRNVTVWSLSYSEWLHCGLSSDALGEVILSILPLPACTSSAKKLAMRRFPIYVTSMLPFEPTEDGSKGGIVEGHAGGGQEAGQTEKSDAEGRQENETDDEGERVGEEASPPLQSQTYEEAVKKYYLHFEDFDMQSLVGLCKRALWKRMKSTETTAKTNYDEMPLTALYKTRFNPNMCSHVWVASGGQAGVVRLHCVRTLMIPQVKTMIGKHQAQFRALYSGPKQRDGVQMEAEQL